MNDIKLEILEANYWEHFKTAKDFSFILPINHPKRQKIELEINKMIVKMKELKQSKPLKTQNE